MKKEGPRNVEANSCTKRGNRKSEQVLSLRELVKNVHLIWTVGGPWGTYMRAISWGRSQITMS